MRRASLQQVDLSLHAAAGVPGLMRSSICNRTLQTDVGRDCDTSA